MSGRLLRLAAVGLVLCALPRGLAAQYDECRPGSGSNEAKTLALFSVPLAFSQAAAPGRPDGITFGIEAANVPSVDPTVATPTICRPGKGPENTDLLAGIARPRLGVPLPLGLALEASWIPPVRVNGVKANLIGLALARSVVLTQSMTAGLRAHATFGEIHAPVTCDHQALGDPASECFHGQLSDDRLSPNIFGLDASLGWRLAGGRLRPYAGSGYSRLQIKTGKAGVFGFAGHNHLIESHAVHGEVVYYPREPARSHLEITVDADSLQVLTPPDTEEMRKVGETMRTQVLRTADYPVIRLVSQEVQRKDGGFHVVGAMTLVGRTRTVPLDVLTRITGDTLEAGSTFSVKQTDFGITPFRGGPGGAVKVADRVDITFKAVGVQVGNGEDAGITRRAAPPAAPRS